MVGHKEQPELARGLDFGQAWFWGWNTNVRFKPIDRTWHVMPWVKEKKSNSRFLSWIFTCASCNVCICAFVSAARTPRMQLLPLPAWRPRCHSCWGRGRPWPGPALGRAQKRCHLWLRCRAGRRWSPGRCSPGAAPRGRVVAPADPVPSSLQNSSRHKTTGSEKAQLPRLPRSSPSLDF